MAWIHLKKKTTALPFFYITTVSLLRNVIKAGVRYLCILVNMWYFQTLGKVVHIFNNLCDLNKILNYVFFPLKQGLLALHCHIGVLCHLDKLQLLNTDWF